MVAISELVLNLITYNYLGKTNLELIVRLLSQIVLKLGNKFDFSAFTAFLKKIMNILAVSKNKTSARE